MRRFAAAVAAIALISGAVQAQGQGQGQGRGSGAGGKPAEAGRQGGGQGGGQGQAERGNRGQGQPQAAQPAGPSMRGSEQRGNGNERRAERASRGNAGNARPAERAAAEQRGGGNDARGNGNAGRGNDGRGNAGGSNEGRAVAVDGDSRRGGPVIASPDFASLAPRGLIQGCPPGLAKKRNGCQPPGQDRRDDRFGWDRPDFWGLALGDGRYFYDDGYLVRYAPSGGLLGYVPLLGGALSIGNAWPDYYAPFALPGYYESYYGLGRSDSYRYADDVIYRIDPETDAITSIAALLTGDRFAVGQPMPSGYDIYNVPYGYRDQYFDRPDARYRYADGYIYEIDPTTQLIAAAIELLVS